MDIRIYWPKLGKSHWYYNNPKLVITEYDPEGYYLPGATKELKATPEEVERELYHYSTIYNCEIYQFDAKGNKIPLKQMVIA